MTFTWFVGLRYLRSKQEQSFISMITMLAMVGIAVGVMALVIVIGVMTGFESELQKKILGIESHVLVMRYGDVVSDLEGTIDHIESIEGVESATPFVYSQVMLRSRNGVVGVVIKGLDPSRPVPPIKTKHHETLAEALAESSMADSSGQPPGLIVGTVAADILAVGVGDPVYLISPLGKGSSVSRVPTVMRFVITGIFETGMNEYDGAMSFIHLNVAQTLLQMPEKATGLEVRVDNIYKAKEVAGNIVSALGFPFWARDWMQMNKNLFSMLRLQKLVMFIILALIVVVAAFNIASALIMMVMEKTRDIAILKTMGATQRHIRQIFVSKGLIIGATGTTIGVVLGLVLSGILKRYQFIHLPGDVYFLTTLPVSLHLSDVLIIGFSSMMICFLASLYPAISASSLRPVEGIRYGQ